MFDNLALFLKIVEKGSLSAAGRTVGLAPATVSERLAALEAHYGATLLTRTTRSVSLTDEGRLLAEGARRLLAEADELESRIRLGLRNVSGHVRLSAPHDLGQTRIVPVIDRFLALHPEVTVELELSDELADLVRDGTDFAVRYGALPDSGLKALPLGENRRVVCAAPAYLQRHGSPGHPDDLLRHDCIVMRNGAEASRVWQFLVDGRPHKVRVRGRRVANTGDLVRRWSLAGHGLCLKSVWDVEADLAAGRLREVLGDFPTGSSGLTILYPQTRIQPRRVRALIDMIVAELRA